jgi:hypothetical protein
MITPWRHLGAVAAAAGCVVLFCSSQIVAQEFQSDRVTEAQDAGGFKDSLR